MFLIFGPQEPPNFTNLWNQGGNPPVSGVSCHGRSHWLIEGRQTRFHSKPSIDRSGRPQPWHLKIKYLLESDVVRVPHEEISSFWSSSRPRGGGSRAFCPCWGSCLVLLYDSASLAPWWVWTLPLSSSATARRADPCGTLGPQHKDGITGC